MTEPIHLRTYTEDEVDLTEIEADYLQAKCGTIFRIGRSVSGSRYVINPQQYAGVVALPSGRRLTVSPRIPTSNILYMLSVAYRLASPFQDELERYESLDRVLEPIAEYFADLAEERVREGLYREYVETAENLHMVRGRIDFPRDIMHNSILRHRTYCSYADFTWDVPENQVIRWTCHRLAHWGFRRSGLRKRLVGLDLQLDEVSLRPYTARTASSCIYHRLNAGYERIHRLCALLLDATSLCETEGSTEFRTFLLDMNKLFEQFITQSLIDRFSPPRMVHAQKEYWFDNEGRVRFRPDLVLSHGDHPDIVADCKYKARSQDRGTIPYDYYQVLAYCTALRLRCGVLIYPRVDDVTDDRLHIINSDVEIYRRMVDVGCPISEMNRELDRLSAFLETLAAPISVIA